MADKLKPTDIDIENMTTPTKEQIEKVMSKSCEGVMVCQHCQYQGQCFAMAKKFITEWEKIRNSTK